MKSVHLRTLRKRKRLTQVQLAIKAKLAQNSISLLETRPTRRPVYSTVVALARALDVDPEIIRFGPARQRRSSRASA